MPKYLCSILFVLFMLNGFTQSCDTAIGFQNMFWFKGLGNFDNFGDFGVSKIISDKNGNIITAGNCIIPDIPSKKKILVTKTTPKGLLLWSKTFELAVTNRFSDIILTKDDGYILPVTVYGEGVSSMVIKLNSDGKVQWSSFVSKDDHLSLYKIIQLKDEDFIIVGGGGSCGGYNYNVICRFDKFGKLVWNKLFFLKNNYCGYAYNILELNDGTLLVSGIDRYFPNSISDRPISRFFLRKLNAATGSEIWSRFYLPKDSTSSMNYFGDLHEKSDHSLSVYLRGSLYNAQSSGFSNTYYRFDSAGNFLGGKKINLNSSNYFVDAYYGATDNKDNDLLYGKVTGNNAYNILFKISNDSVIWAHSYNSYLSTGRLREFTAATVSGNSLIAGGNFISRNLSTNTGKDEYQNYVIKTDINGNTNCSDTFNIPFVITNADTLYPLTAKWIESSGIDVTPKPVIVQDLLPQLDRDCMQKKPCCTDTIVYTNADICNNGSYTLPDQSIVNTPGIYSSYFKTAKGCDSVIFTSLSQTIAPKISLGNDTCLTGGSSIILRVHSNGFTKFIWQDGSTDSTYTVNRKGMYSVKATSYCGIASDSIMIYDKCNLPIYIPNAFSPNSDGLNDVFKIADMKHQQLIDFSIYNRWGTKIFTTTNPLKGWNGKVNGTDQPVSTFQYLIHYKDFSGKQQLIKGTVTLVR